MKYLYLTAIILFLFNGCNSTSKDIIKTSINEVNTQEKNLLNELDSNKTYNIYLGDEKFSNAKFHSCIDNSCTNFTVSINNSQHNLGINENALFIFYPNVTKKFNKLKTRMPKYNFYQERRCNR